MVPNLSKAGTCFKGAFAYHGHDKDRANTSERVAWVSTRNLVTDDLDRAERIMIATSLDADRLKEQAGIRKTGRKSRATVQTLSLSWSPNEKIDRAEMERAADQVLERLELRDYQVAIVAHNDTQHPHVHMIINRVNPNDGRMAGLSNSKRVLDKWANEYERARGQIVTPQRDAKYRRRDDARQKYSPAQRRAYAERKRAEAAKKSEAQVAAETPNKRSVLAARQAEMRQRHSAQWDALKARHKAERNSYYQTYRKQVAAVRQKHEIARQANASQRKAEWRDFYKSVRAAEKTRRRMGRSITGSMALAITAAREESRSGSQESMTRLIWGNFISQSRRETIFTAIAERDKAALSAHQNRARDHDMKQLSERRGQEIEARKIEHQKERDGLKRQQNDQRQDVRDEWRKLNNKRDQLRAIHERTNRMTEQRSSPFDQQAPTVRQQSEALQRHRDEQAEKFRTANEKAQEQAANERRRRDQSEQNQREQARSQHKSQYTANRSANMRDSAQHIIAARTAKADAKEQAGKEKLDRRQDAARDHHQPMQTPPTDRQAEARAKLEKLQRAPEKSLQDRARDAKVRDKGKDRGR